MFTNLDWKPSAVRPKPVKVRERKNLTAFGWGLLIFPLNLPNKTHQALLHNTKINNSLLSNRHFPPF